MTTTELGPRAAIRGYLDELEELHKQYVGNLAVNRAMGRGYRALFRADGRFADFLDADRAYARAVEGLNGRSRSDNYVRLMLRFDLTRWGFPKTADILNDMEQLALEAIKDWPNRAVFHLTAATVARERGDYETAVKRVERALEIEPNFLQAIAQMIHLGDICGNMALRRRGERLLAEAEQRIKDGPPAEVTDDYAQMILAPPR
jgi:tetratricopeptide (TPR) repeat protein